MKINKMMVLNEKPMKIETNLKKWVYNKQGID